MQGCLKRKKTNKQLDRFKIIYEAGLSVYS